MKELINLEKYLRNCIDESALKISKEELLSPIYYGGKIKAYEEILQYIDLKKKL